jgi:hypothetical protein
MTDTSPGELAKIIATEEGFRMYVVQKLERLDAKLESHVLDDDRQFKELRSGLGDVTSGVDTAKDTRSQFVGARNALLGFVAVLTMLSLIGSFIIWMVNHAGKGSP